MISEEKKKSENHNEENEMIDEGFALKLL